MSALFAHYPLACLLVAFIAGGTLGFIGLALCGAAREGDAVPAPNPAAAPREPGVIGIGACSSPLITPGAAAGPTERRPT